MKSSRSNCPINCALELVGDKWTLLIMRDMLIGNKRTFKEFSNSEEGIATNILSNRLALLEDHGIITKSKCPNNKKVNIYAPTEYGFGLLPIVLELAVWSVRHRAHANSDVAPACLANVESYLQDKTKYIEQLKRQFDEQTVG